MYKGVLYTGKSQITPVNMQNIQSPSILFTEISNKPVGLPLTSQSCLLSLKYLFFCCCCKEIHLFSCLVPPRQCQYHSLHGALTHTVSLDAVTSFAAASLSFWDHVEFYNIIFFLPPLDILNEL